ncbi:MAG: oxidoreductase [Gammaproteobacteria bacterium]|nr:oxidoreductase [Gammaproteobacteria bacterium]
MASDAKSGDSSLLAGLNALLGSAFPKTCRACGRVYQTAEEFAAATVPPGNHASGLKAAADDDGTVILECFRNCVCGSTLMDAFADRRDASADGALRRKRFDGLVGQLVERGVEAALARGELKKVLRGEPSEVIVAAIRSARNEA